MLEEAVHIKNTVVLIFRHTQCLHLMNSEAVLALVCSEPQIEPRIILNYLPGYLSVSYGHG